VKGKPRNVGNHHNGRKTKKMKTVMECRVIENYYEKTRMRIFFPLKASHPRIREVSCNFIAVNYGTLRRVQTVRSCCCCCCCCCSYILRLPYRSQAVQLVIHGSSCSQAGRVVLYGAGLFPSFYGDVLPFVDMPLSTLHLRSAHLLLTSLHVTSRRQVRP